MNWIRTANEISKIYRNEILSMALNKINEMQEIYDEVFEHVIEANNYRCKVQDVEDIDDDLMNEINDFKDNNLEKIKITFEKREKLLDSYWEEFKNLFESGSKTITQTCAPLAQSEKELNLVRTRIRTYIIMCNHLGEEFSKYMKELMYNDLEDRLEKNGLDLSYVTVKFEDEEEEIIEPMYPTIEIRNIYEWEDMEELVMENGYVYKRSKGSHRIYEHPKTNKIVVIPAHTIGKGLSVKIQKQIVANY